MRIVLVVPTSQTYESKNAEDKKVLFHGPKIASGLRMNFLYFPYKIVRMSLIAALRESRATIR
jgi:hypothetical protein